MNDSRFAWKVGFFVFVSLALAGLLILNFSKGITLFEKTYTLHIVLPTAAGLKPADDVMMSGVPVGKVATTTLSEDEMSVDITVVMLDKYKIHKGDNIHPDALGFLGDQYISITPTRRLPGAPEAPILTNGETVIGEASFNMQEAVRSISGVVDTGQKVMKDLDKAINNVNNTVLDGATLTNFVSTMNNFQTVTSDAVAMAKEVRATLDSDLPAVHVALTNFAVLSQRLNNMADKLDLIITTNKSDLTDAIKSIRATAADMRQLADGLQAGQGLVGSLLKDEKMKTDFGNVITNISAMADQFEQFGANVNQNGVWHTLFKHKPAATNAPAR